MVTDGIKGVHAGAAGAASAFCSALETVFATGPADGVRGGVPAGPADDDAFERRAIAAARRGETDPYDYLVSKYMRRVMSVAWSFVRNGHEAEELAQEAFVRAWSSMGRFREGQSFGPWIFRIVSNLALDVLKHRTRVREEAVSADLPTGRRDAADTAAFSNEIAARIDHALATLPEMQRIVARLYLVDGFGHAEIAAMLSLTEGTVRSHLSHGRRKLQEVLADLRPAGTER